MRIGPADHGVLAGGIGAHAGRRTQAFGGGHVDDAAGLALEQPGQGGPNQSLMRGHVDGQGPLPEFVVAFRLDRQARGHSGVVYQDVEPSEVVVDLLDRGPNSRGVGDVEFESEGLVPGSLVCL